MGRKNKRNIIPKNRDIEEMVEGKEEKRIEQPEYKEDITMEEVIAQMDKSSQKLKDSRKKEQEQFKKKLQCTYDRKDAQYADELRKRAYSKAITRMEEKEQEEK